MSALLEKFLLIAVLLGFWSGPMPGQDWQPKNEDQREWAAMWTSFAILEGVRAQMEETESAIADGTLTEDARGFANLGAGMLLASVPDVLLMDMQGPAREWQPRAQGQYTALRKILTDRQSIDNPLEELRSLPTDKMFSVLMLRMMTDGGFTSLEIEQLRDTMARSFDQQQ